MPILFIYQGVTLWNRNISGLRGFASDLGCIFWHLASRNLFF